MAECTAETCAENSQQETTTLEGAVGGTTPEDLPKWFQDTYPKSVATFIVFYRGLW